MAKLNYGCPDADVGIVDWSGETCPNGGVRIVSPVFENFKKLKLLII